MWLMRDDSYSLVSSRDVAVTSPTGNGASAWRTLAASYHRRRHRTIQGTRSETWLPDQIVRNRPIRLQPCHPASYNKPPTEDHCNTFPVNNPACPAPLSDCHTTPHVQERSYNLL